MDEKFPEELDTSRFVTAFEQQPVEITSPDPIDTSRFGAIVETEQPVEIIAPPEYLVRECTVQTKQSFYIPIIGIPNGSQENNVVVRLTGVRSRSVQ